MTPPSIPTAATMADLQGPIHRPDDAEYDALRRPWNRAVDPQPAIVAVATSADDVAAAIGHGGAVDIPVTVQATGHGTHVAVDGGILLCTHLMDAVTVDPTARIVRVGAGARWDSVVAACAPYGLAPPAGVGSVGAVGFTVGGGAGPLARTFGLAADSVVGAQVVTADGAVRRVDAATHPELFWALRGGGGGIAVVTELELRVFPVDRVWSGLRVYDISQAADALDALDTWALTAPETAALAAMLFSVPDSDDAPPALRGRTVIGFRVTHVGDDVSGVLASMFDPLGEPLLDTVAATTFAATYVDAPAHEPTGIAQHFGFVEALTDGVADEVINAVTQGRITSAEVRQWGGALARPRFDGGATGPLDAPFSVLMVREVAEPAHHPSVASAAAAVAEAAAPLRPHETGRTFVNFVTDPASVPRAFDPNAYARLAAVTASWNPDGLIRSGLGVGADAVT